MELNTTCCFTGYRPHRFVFTADGLRLEHLQEALYGQIARLYDEGYRSFISGMCIGVDMWAAQQVIALRREHPDVELIAAVPFEGQEKHWAFSDQKEYRRLLDACDRVEVLCRPAVSRENAAACYRTRNRWMVDHAEALLAVYTGSPENVRSGTAATVHYARERQRRILYIHPETLRLAEETVRQLTFPL